jgi:hypothetical protein
MEKSYRAKRHDVIREKQRGNSNEVHHPVEKKQQIRLILNGKKSLKILELFAGQGNLTEVYKDYGMVECHDKKINSKDSYREFHRLIADKKKYDVIDLDPYGFPNRFFPDIFLLIDDLFITMPKPYVNILNRITRQHLTCYYGEYNPGLETIKERIKLYGLCHWRDINFLDITDLGRLWRMAIRVNKVKATIYTNTNNR